MITDTSRDLETGYRIGRCGDWFVRSRPDGASFDLTRAPFKSWEADSRYSGLTLDVAARLLGMAQGDLYDWGKR